MDKFGNLQTNNSSGANQKPAIVIACGAWHVPAHYEPMAKPLREAGFQVFVPQHQSIGIAKDPGNALQNDAAALARVIEHNARLRRDVILLMHSYGGIAGSEAVGILKENRAENRIKRLVFLAAHVIDKDVSFLGSGRSVPNVDINEVKLAHSHLDIDTYVRSQDGMTMHMKPYERYYHEVSPEDAEPAINLLQRMAASAFETSTRYAGWRDYGIPCTYIKCSQDTAVSPSMCDTYIAKMKDAGVQVDVETIEAGHCAHFTAPSAVVGVIEKAASSIKSG